MSPRTTLWHVLRLEARKLTARALVWVEMGVLALLVVALHLALMAALAQPQPGMSPEAVEALRASLRWPQGLLAALTFANGGGLGGLFVAVLVGAVVAQEYTWHTVHLWLSRGVGRGVYLLAKFGVLVAALGLLVLTTLAAGGVVTGAYTVHSLGRLPWEAVPWRQVSLGVLQTTLTLLPYAALTFAVAVITRSTMVAVGVGLGYSLLVENLAVEVLLLLSPQATRVARYLPALLAQSVMQSMSTAGAEVSVGMASPAATALLPPGQATVWIGFYTLAGLLLAWGAFRRQDLCA